MEVLRGGGNNPAKRAWRFAKKRVRSPSHRTELPLRCVLMSRLFLLAAGNTHSRQEEGGRDETSHRETVTGVISLVVWCTGPAKVTGEIKNTRTSAVVVTSALLTPAFIGHCVVYSVLYMVDTRTPRLHRLKPRRASGAAGSQVVALLDRWGHTRRPRVDPPGLPLRWPPAVCLWASQCSQRLASQFGGCAACSRPQMLGYGTAPVVVT